MTMPIKDITNQRFGRLVAIEPLGIKDKFGYYLWRLQCDCGNIKEMSTKNLSNTRGNGKTTSCGCFHREDLLKRQTSPFHAANKKNVIQSYRYKGVAYIKNKKKWCALLSVDGKIINTGLRASEKAAVSCRNAYIIINGLSDEIYEYDDTKKYYEKIKKGKNE